MISISITNGEEGKTIGFISELKEFESALKDIEKRGKEFLNLK